MVRLLVKPFRLRYLLPLLSLVSALLLLSWIAPNSPWNILRASRMRPSDYAGSWSGGLPWTPSTPTPSSSKPQTFVDTYTDAIMSPGSHHIPRLTCPAIDRARYGYLSSSSATKGAKREYLFALDLRRCVDLLPTLLGSIVEAMRFLGPQRCALSIVEGNSGGDGTYEVLHALAARMEELGAAYHLQTADINPARGDRIGKLAKLRNLALEPLFDADGSPSKDYAQDPTVLFVNDVAACGEDLLELVHQRRAQGADMTCAFDWHPLGGRYKGRLAPYDVWVSRAANGDTFAEIPRVSGVFWTWDGLWARLWDEFWNHPVSRGRYQARLPLQVFACWNGAVAMTGLPFTQNKISFRRARRGECEAGEPTLLAKDLWKAGYGKVALVPSVNLGYTVEEGRRVKEEKGYTSHLVKDEKAKDWPAEIAWVTEPPDMVKCMPTFDKQWWAPWDQGLV